MTSTTNPRPAVQTGLETDPDVLVTYLGETEDDAQRFANDTGDDWIIVQYGGIIRLWRVISAGGLPPQHLYEILKRFHPA